MTTDENVFFDVEKLTTSEQKQYDETGREFYITTIVIYNGVTAESIRVYSHKSLKE